MPYIPALCQEETWQRPRETHNHPQVVASKVTETLSPSPQDIHVLISKGQHQGQLNICLMKTKVEAKSQSNFSLELNVNCYNNIYPTYLH